MLKPVLIALLLILPAVSVGDSHDIPAETGGQPAESAGQEATTDVEAADGETKESIADRHKRQVDTQVQRASQWVDSFFSDPNYEAEVANSQLRIRPELYYRDQQGLKVRAKVSLRLMLPSVDHRVSLIAGSGVDDLNSNDSVDDSDDDSVLGLQFFGKKFKGWHTSLSLGFKFNDFAFFVGPRVRYDHAFNDQSSYRFTQTVRWQTNNYWQINSRLDLNHVFNDRFFFRQTFDGRWRGEDSAEEGYRTRVSTFLTQRLENMAGLQYEFSTIFHTRPDTHVDRYTVAVRFRKQTWRDFHLKMNLTTRPTPVSVCG